MPVCALDSKLHGRRRPRALPAVATICAMLLFGAAAWWQYGRMTQKVALRAELDAASIAAPVALPSPATASNMTGADATGSPTTAWTAWRYRPVFADGSFDAAHQILIDNKIRDGRVGYHVVTPLRLTDGRTVLVNRGYVAGGSNRAVLPMVPPPAGSVVVRGRVALASARYLELRTAIPAGPVWQNLDPDRFAAATGIAVLPVIIEQTAAIDAADTLLRDWPAPDLGVERHQIYMVQWLVFMALAGGLWIYFNLRRFRG